MAELMKLCRGNSRLVLAVSAAFAGPLIILVGAESGALNIYGGSSKGKTTIVFVAGSVWGGKDVAGFMKSWLTTATGLEWNARQHCDTLLILDEMGQAKPEVVAEGAYDLIQGESKQRGQSNGDGQPTHRWRAFILSTGEITLNDRLKEGDIKAHAGQMVRVVDISIDAGAGMGASKTFMTTTTPVRSLARSRQGP